MSSPVPVDSLLQFQAELPYPLDAFQLEAMDALARGRSVLVAAPTGTGKTWKQATSIKTITPGSKGRAGRRPAPKKKVIEIFVEFRALLSSLSGFIYAPGFTRAGTDKRQVI